MFHLDLKVGALHPKFVGGGGDGAVELFLEICRLP
jgi:hypothetical protein